MPHDQQNGPGDAELVVRARRLAAANAHHRQLIGGMLRKVVEITERARRSGQAELALRCVDLMIDVEEMGETVVLDTEHAAGCPCQARVDLPALEHVVAAFEHAKRPRNEVLALVAPVLPVRWVRSQRLRDLFSLVPTDERGRLLGGCRPFVQVGACSFGEGHELDRAARAVAHGGARRKIVLVDVERETDLIDAVRWFAATLDRDGLGPERIGCVVTTVDPERNLGGWIVENGDVCRIVVP
jgi:hypothetical protein